MLGVYEGRHSSGLLRLGYGVEGDSGLSGALGPKDLDYPSAWKSAYAKRDVKWKYSGGYHIDSCFERIPQPHYGPFAKPAANVLNGQLQDILARLRNSLFRQVGAPSRFFAALLKLV